MKRFRQFLNFYRGHFQVELAHSVFASAARKLRNALPHLDAHLSGIKDRIEDLNNEHANVSAAKDRAVATLNHLESTFGIVEV